jgi:hybrid cluster-associated redox disulfide protein
MEKQYQFVTKDMFLIDIISRYPEATPILMGYGLHCIGCHFSGADTLEMGARMHGMDDEIMEMMLKDVNLIIKKFSSINNKNPEIDKTI